MKNLPISFLVLTALGVPCLIVGALAMAGVLQKVHPLLNFEGGLALIVTGIALLLSAAFPLAIRLLSAKG